MLQQVLNSEWELMSAIILLPLYLNTDLVSEIEYRSVQTKTFLEKIYKKDGKELISTLIQKKLVSSNKYEYLKKYWKGGDKRK